MVSRRVEDQLARFDEITARLDGHVPSRPAAGRAVTRVGRKVGNIAIAMMALVAAAVGYGLFVGPIGLGGLFLVALALVLILVFFSVFPREREPKRVQYSEQLPTRAVVQQLGALLNRRRTALPGRSARLATL